VVDSGIGRRSSRRSASGLDNSGTALLYHGDELAFVPFLVDQVDGGFARDLGIEQVGVLGGGVIAPDSHVGDIIDGFARFLSNLSHRAVVIQSCHGGEIVRAERLMHGKTSDISHDGQGVFAGLPTPLTATRYHSLMLDENSMPESLEVTARTADGMVMGVRHREFDVEGVQFHPESILTGAGHDLLQNFLNLTRPDTKAAA